MDGVFGRPGVGSSTMAPPSAPTSYQGNFQAGLIFGVTQTLWFEGYWWFVPNGGDTGSQEFCLFTLKTVNGSSPAASSVPIEGSVVSSGTLTAGGWNWIPLDSPLPISVGIGGPSAGGLFIATTAYVASAGFADTNNAFGAADPYADGITNGPLFTIGESTPISGSPDFPASGSTFATSSADPTAQAPPLGSDGSFDMFWLDVQVSDSEPGYAGSYRLWPNRATANQATTADAAVNYVIATEVHLSEPCDLNAVWYYSPPGTAQLATRASVYSIDSPSTGTEVAVISSPSWSGDAASGWVKASFPSGVTLPAGSYKVAVHNNAATPDMWSAKDAGSDYWQSGEGANGVSFGPLTAPKLDDASLAYTFDQTGNLNTPPFSDGTGATVKGQPTFAMSGPAYPYLYAPVGDSGNATQNYWVDLEVTPNSSGGSGTMATHAIPVVSVSDPETAAASAGQALSAGDVGTVAPARGLTLALVNASTATTAVISAGEAPAKTVTVGASETTYVRLADSSYYVQSDGLIHVTATAAMTATAITH
jgi:hypothetical protein